jgi:hypothetical protein
MIACHEAVGRMQTELKNSWRTGFRLTEKELRRIIDLTIEKIKTQPDQDVQRKITYKLANGAIIETTSVDDLFGEENVGTKRIVGLRAQVHVDGGMSSEIIFTDLVSEKEEKNSMVYRLKGEVRDPLFVLASELDERINQIKQIKLWPEKASEIITFVLMISTFGIMSLITYSTSGSASPVKAVLDAYDAGKFSQDLQGLFKFIARLESARVSRELNFSIWQPVGLLLVICAIASALWLFSRNFLYPFNFVWGDQIGVIERRDRTRNFIIVGIGITMIIGIASSYLAGLLPKL